MDTLKDMALFVEVARARSFKRAAEKLGMPNSSLSRRIAGLEEALGLQLMNRTTRRIELTEAGQHYFARSKAIVEAALAAQDEVRGMLETPRGVLRISMSADFGTTYMAPVIKAYSRAYPDVAIECDLSPRRVDLIAEEFDIAIRVGKLEDSGLIARRLISARSALFAAPEYLRERGTPKLPSDLVGHACLRIMHPGSASEWVLNNGRQTTRVEIGGRIAANNPRMVLRLAVQGAGIAAVDEHMAAEDVMAKQLVKVLPRWNLPPIPIYAVTASRLLPAKTRRFIELAIRALSGQSGSEA